MLQFIADRNEQKQVALRLFVATDAEHKRQVEGRKVDSGRTSIGLKFIAATNVM